VPAHEVNPVAHVAWHLPCWHVALASEGAVQVVPHAPQCMASEARSVQLPLHSVVPDGQLDAHFPFAQTWPVAHAAPQAPQFFGSFVRAAHALPHIEEPVLHDKAHLPF